MSRKIVEKEMELPFERAYTLFTNEVTRNTRLWVYATVEHSDEVGKLVEVQKRLVLWPVYANVIYPPPYLLTLQKMDLSKTRLTLEWKVHPLYVLLIAVSIFMLLLTPFILELKELVLVAMAYMSYVIYAILMHRINLRGLTGIVRCFYK